MSDKKGAIAREIYKAVARLTDDREFLSILGSYGDTLDDDDILSLLRDYNLSGKSLHERH
jgi:hypothetical protein